MKQLFSSVAQVCRADKFGRRQAAALVPGLLLIALGLAAVLAPQIIAFLVAAFLMYFGVVALFVGWKIVQLRRKVQQMMQDLSRRVQVVAFDPASLERGDRERGVLEDEMLLEVDTAEDRGDLPQDEIGREEEPAPVEIRKIIVH